MSEDDGYRTIKGGTRRKKKATIADKQRAAQAQANLPSMFATAPPPAPVPVIVQEDIDMTPVPPGEEAGEALRATGSVDGHAGTGAGRTAGPTPEPTPAVPVEAPQEATGHQLPAYNWARDAPGPGTFDDDPRRYDIPQAKARGPVCNLLLAKLE